MPRIRIQYQYHEDDTARRCIRWMFLSVAAMCFGWAGFMWMDQRVHQAEAEVLFEEASVTPPPSIRHDSRSKFRDGEVSATAPLRRGPIAKLEIPRLGVSGYVDEGVDTDTLRQSIGHIPSSARPGQRGNIVLAAHRDTFFSGLRNIKAGDKVELKSPGGESIRYEVSKVFVVSPQESWVLRTNPNQNMLTLITCYPFQFVGPAPSRLVVQARPLPIAAARRTAI